MKFAVIVSALLLTAPSLLAAPATAFIVQASTADTGVPFNFTVRAIDSSNNTDVAYAGTVHFTSSDGAAVLPADYTFTPADGGVHTFSAKLHGDNVTHTITVTDTANSSIKGLAGVYVFNPNLVTSLSLAAPGTVHREQSVSVTVSARNARGEIVSTYGGTVHFTSDKSATLPADYAFTPADAGSRTFSVVFHAGWLNTLQVADVASGGGGGIGDALAEVYVICPELTASAFNNGPICPGGVATISAQTNAASPTFFWQQLRSGGPPPEGWPTTQTFTTSGSGTWEVIVTDTATGCIARAETSVSFEPTPSISFPQGARACENSEMVATLENDPSGPYSDIVWSVTGASIVSGQGTATITIRADAPVYPQPSKFIGVGVVATRSATQCRRDAQVPADFDAQAPVLALSGPDALCGGATARVAVVPGSDAITSLQWSLTGATEVGRGAAEFFIDVVPTGSGAMSVTATYTTVFGTCDRSVTKTISVNGGTSTIAAQTSVCPNTGGHSASVSDAGPGATYSWTINDGAITSGQGTPNITWSSASSDVQLGATVTANGCTTSTSKTVVVTPSATITDQPDSVTVSSGSTATLEVQASGDDLVYEWFQGTSGDMSTPVGSNSPIFMTPPLMRSTSYWVKVSNGCGSAASDAALVTVSGTTKRRAARK